MSREHMKMSECVTKIKDSDALYLKVSVSHFLNKNLDPFFFLDVDCK